MDELDLVRTICTTFKGARSAPRRPPACYPGHRLSQAGRHHARRAHSAGEGPTSRRSSLEPSKITVEGARRARVTAWWRYALPWTAIFPGSISASTRRMARS